MGFYARYANLISSFFHFLICPGFKIEDVVHTPPPLHHLLTNFRERLVDALPCSSNS